MLFASSFAISTLHEVHAESKRLSGQKSQMHQEIVGKIATSQMQRSYIEYLFPAWAIGQRSLLATCVDTEWHFLCFLSSIVMNLGCVDIDYHTPRHDGLCDLPNAYYLRLSSLCDMIIMFFWHRFSTLCSRKVYGGRAPQSLEQLHQPSAISLPPGLCSVRLILPLKHEFSHEISDVYLFTIILCTLQQVKASVPSMVH